MSERFWVGMRRRTRVFTSLTSSRSNNRAVRSKQRVPQRCQFAWQYYIILSYTPTVRPPFPWLNISPHSTLFLQEAKWAVISLWCTDPWLSIQLSHQAPFGNYWLYWRLLHHLCFIDQLWASNWKYFIVLVPLADVSFIFGHYVGKESTFAKTGYFHKLATLKLLLFMA